ncbi:trypsin-like peptidase domain-containing protein [Magnetococcales bacterium HHB-1]
MIKAPHQSNISCGKEMHKYLYMLIAFATMILIATYWYLNFYQDSESVNSDATITDITTGAPPSMASNGVQALQNGNPVGVNGQFAAGGQAASIPMPSNVPSLFSGANNLANSGMISGLPAVATPVNGPMMYPYGSTEKTANDLMSFSGVVQRILPSVVNVSAQRQRPSAVPAPADAKNGQSTRPAIDLKFANPFTGVAMESIGSGVVVTSDGYVVSNFHVVEHAQDNIFVTIFTPQGTQRYPARVIRMDSARDLVLLKINVSQPLPAAALGTGVHVQPGDPVIAIGCPFGLDQTVSKGIISGTRKALTIEGVVHKGLLQTDAAINQGNSGGPLVDARGFVIGINTAIYSPTQAFSGVGFAVPVDSVREFLSETIQLPDRPPPASVYAPQNPNMMPPISSMPRNSPAQQWAAPPAPSAPYTSWPGSGRRFSSARSNGLVGQEQWNGGYPQNNGAWGGAQPYQSTAAPQSVAPQPFKFSNPADIGKTVAAQAGVPPIQANALCPHEDRGPCKNCHELIQTGQAVRQQNMMGGGNGNGHFAFSPSGAIGLNVAMKDNSMTLLGAELITLNREQARRHQSPFPTGVYVKNMVPNAKAEQSGFKNGDIIFKVNGRWVRSLEGLDRQLSRMNPGDKVRFSVVRNQERMNLSVLLEQTMGSGNGMMSNSPGVLGNDTAVMQNGGAQNMIPNMAVPQTQMRMQQGQGRAQPGTSVNQKPAKKKQKKAPRIPTEFEWMGTELTTIQPKTVQMNPQLKGKQGALVGETDANSLADKAGLRPGDLIYTINGIPVGTNVQLDQAIKASKKAKTILLDIERGNRRMFVTLK